MPVLVQFVRALAPLLKTARLARERWRVKASARLTLVKIHSFAPRIWSAITDLYFVFDAARPKWETTSVLPI